MNENYMMIEKLFVTNTVLFVNSIYSIIINLLKNIAAIFTYRKY